MMCFSREAGSHWIFRTPNFETHPLDPLMTAAMIGPAGKWGYGVDKSPFESDGHACLSVVGDQRCAPKKWRVWAASRDSLRLDWIPPSTLKLEAWLIMFECCLIFTLGLPASQACLPQLRRFKPSVCCQQCRHICQHEFNPWIVDLLHKTFESEQTLEG